MMIFGAPSRYVQGQGVLAQIGRELSRIGSSAVILVDAAVADAILPQIEKSCREAGVAVTSLRFGGECAATEIDRLERELGDAPAAVVVGAGGGKCIDSAKALGARIRASIATVPTIASNDSPTSHIYVLYDDSHRLLGVERLERNPALVLVDTDVLIKAPSQFLRAGIGDCLVKKYEVERCVEVNGQTVFLARPSLAALAMARSSYDILLADAEAALAAVEAGTVNAAFERIIEACVLMSGLSFENGGLCIAHAMTRGLSAVAQTAQAMHGFQVAYGVTVQLVLEGRDDAFMADHARFCRAIGLPLSLRELGLSAPAEEEYSTIADLTLSTPHMANFPRPIGKPEFLSAMRDVERRFSK